MAFVEVRQDEALDSALRRFRRKVRKERLMEEIISRLWYEKPSDRKRRRKHWARKRAERNPITKSPPEAIPRGGMNLFRH